MACVARWRASRWGEKSAARAMGARRDGMRGAGIWQFGRRTAGVVNEEAVAGVVAGGGGVRLAGVGKC